MGASGRRIRLVLITTMSILGAACAGAPPSVAPPSSISPSAALADSCAVTTLAGKAGAPGTADGVGADARFSLEPQYIVFDSHGDLFLTDTAAHVIRKVSPQGSVTTFAGSAEHAGSTDGQGSAVRFNRPSGIVIDTADNLYVADGDNNVIRRITPDGVTTTFAIGFTGPTGLAIDPQGNLYVGSWEGNTIEKVTPDGKVATLAGSHGVKGWNDGKGSAASFEMPIALAYAPDGMLYVLDVGPQLFSHLRTVTADGTVTTIKESWRYGDQGALMVDRDGTIFTTSYPYHTVLKVAQDGTEWLLAGKVGSWGALDGPGTSALFSGPIGIVRDAVGLFYIVDSDNSTLRTMSCTGI